MFGSSRKKQKTRGPEGTILPEPTPEALRVSQDLGRTGAVHRSEPPRSASQPPRADDTERDSPRQSLVRVRTGPPQAPVASAGDTGAMTKSTYSPPSPIELVPRPTRPLDLVPRPSRPLDSVKKKPLEPAPRASTASRRTAPPALPLALQPRKAMAVRPPAVKTRGTSAARSDETLRMWTLPPTSSSVPHAQQASIETLEAAAALIGANAFRIGKG